MFLHNIYDKQKIRLESTNRILRTIFLKKTKLSKYLFQLNIQQFELCL